MRSLRYQVIWPGVLALVLLLGAAPAGAQERLKRQKHLIELGLFVGGFFPSSTHSLFEDPNVTSTPLAKAAPAVGVRMAYLPYPYFGLELEGSFMPTKVREGGESAMLFAARLHALVQIPLPKRFTVFALAGGGMIGVSSDDPAVGSDFDPALHWGLGAKYYANHWLAVRLDLRHSIAARGSLGQGHYVEATAGISFVLRWKRVPDFDKDGVPDDVDKCPRKAGPKPEGCPKVPVKPRRRAAPARRAAPPPRRREPPPRPTDSDKDGIPDLKDKCPTEHAKSADGCPPKDSDKDGLLDSKDKCPKKAETKNGFQDADGCPDVIPVGLRLVLGVVKGLRFTRRGKIQRASFRVLNRIVAALKKFPEVKLAVRGHTSNRGKAAQNLKSSQARAQAVKEYLVKQGIVATRLTAEGLGSKEPLASNKSRRGRARNRRVELKLVVGK